MDSKRTLISWILSTAGLLILCFTVGYWQSSPTYSNVPYKLQCSNDSSLDFKAHHLQVDFNESSLAMEKLPFPPCDLKYSEHTSCLTMSFAPRDSHEAQVLERGIPAMIGIMASERIPYPARAFDMAHCSRCLIPWTNMTCILAFPSSSDGLFLIELDGVLRPGGYWILSEPPINWKERYKGWQRTEEDLKQEQDGIEDLAKRLCWKKVIEEGDLAIWQKPINHIECLQNREVYRAPPICEKDKLDNAW